MLSSVVFLLLCQYAVSNHDPLAHEFHEITTHYDDRLCQHLLSVDCSHHVVHGHSERLCGTDMVQYESFCVFAHARCTNHTLSMLNKGECLLSTVGPTGMAATGEVLTTSDVLTTGDVLTTAAVAPVHPTGVDPAFAVMKDVFCNNLHQITCGTAVTADICGNDGKIYNSQCMFSKTKCYKVDLEVAEASTCGDTGMPLKTTPSS
ncbi:uncharacterized protein [Haliotis cracherodii]|uniref:uncharacterized protein n=1 Tax=Haliotis cracherodii TaxID=6455 RepID=UPI0039ED113F